MNRIMSRIESGDARRREPTWRQIRARSRSNAQVNRRTEDPHLPQEADGQRHRGERTDKMALMQKLASVAFRRRP